MNIFPTHRGMKSHDVDIGHKINGRPSLSHLLAEKGDSEGLEYFFFDGPVYKTSFPNQEEYKMRHLPIELIIFSKKHFGKQVGIVIFSKKQFGKQVGTENVPLQDGG